MAETTVWLDEPFFREAATILQPAVVLDRNANGRTEWRIAGSGETLKDYQTEQLPPATQE